MAAAPATAPATCIFIINIGAPGNKKDINCQLCSLHLVLTVGRQTHFSAQNLYNLNVTKSKSGHLNI